MMCVRVRNIKIRYKGAEREILFKGLIEEESIKVIFIRVSRLYDTRYPSLPL